MHFEADLLKMLIESLRHPKGWSLNDSYAQHSHGLTLKVLVYQDLSASCWIEILRRHHDLDLFHDQPGTQMTQWMETTDLCRLQLSEPGEKGFQQAWSEQIGVMCWQRLQALAYVLCDRYDLQDPYWQYDTSGGHERLHHKMSYDRGIDLPDIYTALFFSPQLYLLQSDHRFATPRTVNLRPASSGHALLQAYHTMEAWKPEVLALLRP